jgi:hypothetical protein
MINLVFVALVMLNLHAHFQLQIQMPWFFILLNLVVFGMITSYFDTASNQEIDDPVERIITKPQLLVYAFLFACLYMYIIYYHLNV